MREYLAVFFLSLCIKDILGQYYYNMDDGKLPASASPATKPTAGGAANVGSGRRGDVLNAADVDDQTIFNIDNPGGSVPPVSNFGKGGYGGNGVKGGYGAKGGHTGSGIKGGYGGNGAKGGYGGDSSGGMNGLDCDTIRVQCQCGGGGMKSGVMSNAQGDDPLSNIQSPEDYYSQVINSPDDGGKLSNFQSSGLSNFESSIQPPSFYADYGR